MACAEEHAGTQLCKSVSQFFAQPVGVCLLVAGGAEDVSVGHQQWHMPAPSMHPAMVQAMLQAAAGGGQCMPPLAAAQMAAAAFSGRPPGLNPLQQVGL